MNTNILVKKYIFLDSKFGYRGGYGPCLSLAATSSG